MNWFIKATEDMTILEKKSFISNDKTVLITKCDCDASCDLYVSSSGESYGEYAGIDREIGEFITKIPEEFTWKITQ